MWKLSYVKAVSYPLKFQLLQFLYKIEKAVFSSCYSDFILFIAGGLFLAYSDYK